MAIFYTRISYPGPILKYMSQYTYYRLRNSYMESHVLFTSNHVQMEIILEGSGLRRDESDKPANHTPFVVDGKMSLGVDLSFIQSPSDKIKLIELGVS